MTVSGLVLAAGGGSRLGRPKALVPWHGRLLVQHAVAALTGGGADEVIVVLGASADDVRTAAPDLPRTVDNPDWRRGMGSSLRTGLAALGDATDAAVIVLVDMPGVTAAAVGRLVAVAATDALAMGGYGDRRGHPVLLGRDHWAGVIATAAGDRGARDYLRANAVVVVPVGDVADDFDVDVPEDLARA